MHGLRMKIPNADDLIRRYCEGASLLQLQKESGYGRGPIAKYLRDRGIPLRGGSEACKLRWKRIGNDRAATERLLSKAWAVAKGRRRTLHERERGALTVFERGAIRRGRRQTPVVDEVIRRVPTFVREYPVGPYNVDIADERTRVAVEVHCHTGWQRSLRAERIEYVLDRGWSVLMIYADRRYPIDVSLLAEQAIAYAQRASTDPTMIGQYGMIGRHGQPITPRGYEFPHRPRVSGF